MEIKLLILAILGGSNDKLETDNEHQGYFSQKMVVFTATGSFDLSPVFSNHEVLIALND